MLTFPDGIFQGHPKGGDKICEAINQFMIVTITLLELDIV